MDVKLLGERIAKSMKDREYNLVTLASAIGVHKSTISRYVNGQIDTPKIPVIESIGNELHVNPAWLMGKSEDKSYSPRGTVMVINSPNHLFSSLKKMRENLSASADDVAYSLGISKEDYLAIEGGKNTDCITLAKIALFFCCSTDYAMSWDGIVNEDVQLSFIKDSLLRLQFVFGKLSDDQRAQVIDFANKLLNESK